MSQIEPDDDEMMADMEPEQFEDWGDQPVEQRMWAGHPRPPMRPPVGWQPGFPPPGTRPPFGPVPPMTRPPGPGKWPFWGYWGYRMLAAWRDIKFLKKLVGEIVEEDIVKAIEQGIIAPGPNSPVPGPGGGTTGTGGVIVSPTAPANPAIGQLWFDTTTDQVKFWTGTAWEPLTAMQGVTDGSQAQPGQIGEVVTLDTTGSFTASGLMTQNASMILPAGDWDAEANWILWGGSSVNGANFCISPAPTTGVTINPIITGTPPAVSGWLQGPMQTSQAALEVYAQFLTLTSQTVQINTSAQTLLPFALQVDQATPALLGWEFQVFCRRRR